MPPRERNEGLSCALVLLVVLLPALGCGPDDPLDRVVAAGTTADYHRWTYRHAASLGREAERELNAALDQMKLRLQLERAGAPPDEIRRAALARIDGLTAREIITQAHVWRHRYLAQQNEADDRLAEVNAQLPLLGGVDGDGLARFADQLRNIRARQRERSEEMARLEARLRELNADAEIDRLLEREDEPAPQPDREPAPSPAI